MRAQRVASVSRAMVLKQRGSNCYRTAMGKTHSRTGRGGGSGLTIRTPDEMKATEIRVVQPDWAPAHLQELVPARGPQDRFQVQIYSQPHGRFIHRSYARTMAEAQRAMDAERALKIRVKCDPLPEWVPPSRDRRGGRRIEVKPPPPRDPQVAILQEQLRTVLQIQGKTERAMPTTVSKLKKMLADALRAPDQQAGSNRRQSEDSAAPAR
jgi:hypothetical protein